MSLEEVQQNYADATGMIYDRSVNPPKILGQAFLISRTRAVCCATSVYNYSEAPWALSLYFIHPNVTAGIRSMVLHPEFDKKAARTWYLGQNGTPGEQLVLNNDIATLTIDMQLPDMPIDKIGELNRALSLPFSSQGVESSGNIHGEEFMSVLHKIVSNRSQGLLTLFDDRNIPLARIQVTANGIQKVYFKGLLGELALFELVYRMPAQGYAFSSTAEFNWGNVRDITAPTDALVQEAMRRKAEMPSAFSYLGGPDARYAQRIENYDASSASEQIQWFAERLWACIDGYLTLDKMSERAGADTYSILQAIREMVNKAQISQINRPPFHMNGQLGAPLISHTDFEVDLGDQLQACFLDPLSGRQVWMLGNSLGVATALQPKNMLHTIQVPGAAPGGMIQKDYKLIGIHGGPYTPKPGQVLPTVQGKIYQYMWMGALLDITSSKKGREGDASMTGAAAMSGLRSQSAEDKLTAPSEKLLKLICPNCHATNTQPGPCFNCGTQVDAPEEIVEDTSTGVAKVLKQLEEKTKLPQKQLKMVGGGIVILLLLGVIAMLAGGGSPPPPPTVTTSSNEHPSSEKATNAAVKYSGFKATPIPGYWYEDTSESTKPNDSFGMSSEQSNQRILFVIMDNMAAVSNLQSFVGLPPYCDVFRASDLGDLKIDEGYQVLGDGNFHWFVGKYTRQSPAEGEGPVEQILIGAYPSPQKGTAILVIGRALAKNKSYDYKSTLWLCDQMATDYTATGNSKRTGEGEHKMIVGSGTTTAAKSSDADKPLASDSDIDEFAKHVAADIQDKLKIPDDAKEELKKKKKGLKASINVGISGEDGKINKLEITQQSEVDALNGALSKAINAATPFKDPPRTKEGTINVTVTLDKEQKIKVTRQ
jgi:hypothetical protein